MKDSQAFADPSRLHFEFPITNREARFKERVLYVSHECIDDPIYSKISNAAPSFALQNRIANGDALAILL